MSELLFYFKLYSYAEGKWDPERQEVHSQSDQSAGERPYPAIYEKNTNPEKSLSRRTELFLMEGCVSNKEDNYALIVEALRFE